MLKIERLNYHPTAIAALDLNCHQGLSKRKFADISINHVKQKLN